MLIKRDALGKFMKGSIRFVDISGKKFERITVISFYGSDKNGSSKWNYICDCGNTTVSYGGSLKSGRTKSCGCLKLEITKKRTFIHGMSNTRFYNIWVGMKQRCNNSEYIFYSYYGGRGIKYDLRWELFNNFFKDMYNSYLNHVRCFGEKQTTLDRMNGNGNYSKKNCRWATRKEQRANQRIKIESII